MPERCGAIIGIGVKLLDEARNAVGSFIDIVGGEIRFDGSGADAHVVGIQRGVHEIVEMVGVAKLAAPERELVIERVERFKVASDGTFEKMFRLRLRSEPSDCFEAEWLSRGYDGVARERGGLHLVHCRPFRVRVAGDFKSNQGRDGSEGRDRHGESAEKVAD